MNEREIFIAATHIEDARLRAAFLDSVCQEDMLLRHRIDSLLGAEAAAGGMVDRPARLIDQLAGELAKQHESDPHPEHRSGEHPSPQNPFRQGSTIGPYQIQQLLGEGGMGVVYVAKQTEPVKRLVALKILRPGDNSRNVLARFEQERHALAMMDHPGIAKVLDAGTTDDGRPYFVMELVKGIPISEYCDRENLSPTERLQLFIPVCVAVQHAHQKGIIHRDLKPSNILVALYDGQPLVKVIDFGVAKAIGFRLSENSIYTEVGSIVGTVEYMAPEQAELNNLDIDTRADVYALGVVLYELLTGAPPFTRRELQSAAFDEMLRIIREVEPPKPSTKISASDEIASIAAHRKLEPRQLTRMLSGDLDWVVMKALAKERKRRYQSAGELSADIHRFLNMEAVEAGPPRASYRFGKFLRRNRILAIATGFVVLALFVGSIAAVWGAIHANRAYEKEVAERQQAELISGLLESLFADLDTYSFETDIKSSLRERLGVLVRQISETPSLRPLTAARLQDVIAHTYLGLGEYKAAESLLQTAWATRARLLGESHADALASRHTLAFAMTKQGNFAAALPIFQAVFAGRKQALGPFDRDTLRSQLCIATCLLQQERRQDARLEIESIKRIIADGHPLYDSDQQILDAIFAIDDIHSGKGEDATASLRNIYQTRHDHFGSDHPSTLDALENLAMMYQLTDDWKQALPLYEKLVAGRVSRQGATHPETLTSKQQLARAYRKLEMTEKEIPLWEELIDASRTAQPVDNRKLCGYLASLGSCRFKQKEYVAAEKNLKEALELYKQEFPGKAVTFQVQSLLGAAITGQRSFARAEPLLIESYQGLLATKSQLPRSDREKVLSDALERIVSLYTDWEKPDQVEQWRTQQTTDINSK